MISSRLGWASGAIAVTTALALSGCGGGGQDADKSSSDKPTVVTSTNVYADIASQVAGDFAEVSPVIDDPNQDPHEYEATSQDKLQISKADLIVENGGGYDAYMTTMLEGSDSKAEIVDAVAVSGLPGSEGLGNEPHDHGEEGHDHDHEGEDDHDHEGEDGHDHEGEDGHDHEGEDGHDHGEFNEHVWYSVPTVTKVVDALAEHLGEVAPDHKDDFTTNADEYKKTLGEITAQMDESKKAHKGDKVAATEPVPLWLFADMGLENITSDDFLEAVEAGNDVSPQVLKKAEEQVSSGDAKLLGFNTQAAGPQAEKLKSAAEKADVPVIDLAETMPADTHYADWMGGYVTEISDALGKN